MVLPYIIALCLCGAFCLLPLSIYLFCIAQIAKRSRRTPISGQWDFVGLLAGLSGFILFGGALLLSLAQSNFRYWMRGNLEALRTVWIQERVTWMILVGIYLSVVIGIAAITYMSRRRTLVIYNVDPGTIETIVSEVFDQLGMPAERRGKQWVSRTQLCEMDTSESGRCAVIRWLTPDQRFTEDAERLLRAALATVTTRTNPARAWLMSAAVGTGVVVGCSFGLLIFAISLLR